MTGVEFSCIGLDSSQFVPNIREPAGKDHGHSNEL